MTCKRNDLIEQNVAIHKV